jgi:hypothetical protein
MTTTKHTPGPWAIRTAATYRSQVEAIGPKGRADVVARITTPRKGGAEASDANAHLIAAAPVMLAALERVERILVNLCNEYPGHQPDLDAIRAAIAKAKP